MNTMIVMTFKKTKQYLIENIIKLGTSFLNSINAPYNITLSPNPPSDHLCPMKAENIEKNKDKHEYCYDLS